MAVGKEIKKNLQMEEIGKIKVLGKEANRMKGKPSARGYSYYFFFFKLEEEG